MRILSVVPARKGSKGIKNKNLLLIRNKSLLEHAVAFANHISDKVIISTDIPEVLNDSFKTKAVKHHRRDELCGDRALAWDVWKDASRPYWDDFDVFLYLEPTSPFRVPKDIAECIRLLSVSNNCATVSELFDSKYHYKKQMFVNCKGEVITQTYNNEPRQVLEKAYIRNGLCYSANLNHLTTSPGMINKTTTLIPTSRNVVNIDSQKDFDSCKLSIFTSDFLPV